MMVHIDVWSGDIYAGSLPPICALTGEATSGVHSVRFLTTPSAVARDPEIVATAAASGSMGVT